MLIFTLDKKKNLAFWEEEQIKQPIFRLVKRGITYVK